MKHLTFTRLLPLVARGAALLATGLLAASAGHAQAPTLVVDQARTLPSLATPGSGTLLDLSEVSDAAGNTYQAASFTGTVHFGPFSFTSSGANAEEVAVAKRNAAGVYQWAVAGGGPGEQRAKALAVDAAGNVVVTGHYASATATFGPTTLTNSRPANTSTSDVFVAKVGAGGAWQWAVSAGGGTYINGNDYGTAAAMDVLGNVYVAGTYTSSYAYFGPSIRLPTADNANGGRPTIFLAQLDAAGTWQWARRNNYYSGDAVALATDAAANVYLAANFGGLAQFGSFVLRGGPAAWEAAVVKLTSAGDWLWAVNSASQRYTYTTASSLRLGAQGELYLTGTFTGDTATFGQTHLRNYGPKPPPPNGADPYYHTDDAFLARLNATTGGWRWAVQSHGDGYEYFSQPLPVGSTALYVSATTYEPKFQHAPLAPGHQFGNTTVNTAGGTDIIITRLDTAGTWQWVAQAGGTANESASPRYVDSQGHVCVAGTFNGNSLTLGTTTLASDVSSFYGLASYNSTYFGAVLGSNGMLATVSASFTSAWVVYPNPTHAAFTVSGLPAGQPVQLLDVLGRVVVRATTPPHGTLHLTLPAGLAPGFYVVRADGQSRQLLVE